MPSGAPDQSLRAGLPRSASRWASARAAVRSHRASMASCALFMLVRFVWAVGLTASTAAPQVGTSAPEFSLLDEHQRPWSLATILTAPLAGGVTASAPKGPRTDAQLVPERVVHVARDSLAMNGPKKRSASWRLWDRQRN
jgi:flagellar biosynthesis/type III secretory pathway M-ring protein FliF/YscJ